MKRKLESIELILVEKRPRIVSYSLRRFYQLRHFVRANLVLVFCALLHYHTGFAVYDGEGKIFPYVYDLVLFLFAGPERRFQRGFPDLPILGRNWHFWQIYPFWVNLLFLAPLFLNGNLALRDAFFLGVPSVLSHVLFESGAYGLFLRFFRSISFPYYLQHGLGWYERGLPNRSKPVVERSFHSAFMQLTRVSSDRACGHDCVLISVNEAVFFIGFHNLFVEVDFHLQLPFEIDIDSDPWEESNLRPFFPEHKLVKTRHGRHVPEPRQYDLRSFSFRYTNKDDIDLGADWKLVELDSDKFKTVTYSGR
jgi:hypothetical protein